MAEKTGTILAALGSLALAVAAVPLFQNEYAAVLFSRLGEFDQLSKLSQGAVSLPPTVRSERIILRSCEGSLGGTLGQFMPQETRDSLRETCGDLSRQAAGRAPTSSWAQLVVAATAQADADFSQALALSQATGGYESELAQRRFVLAIGRLEQLSPEARAALSTDITLLVQVPGGPNLVAERYLALAETREFVADAVDRAPEGAQRAFVAAVRRVGG